MQVEGCIIIMKYFGIYFEVLSPLIRLHFFKKHILFYLFNQIRVASKTLSTIQEQDFAYLLEVSAFWKV